MKVIQSDDASHRSLERAYPCHVTQQQNTHLSTSQVRVYRRLIIQLMNPPTMTPSMNVTAVASTGWRFIR